MDEDSLDVLRPDLATVLEELVVLAVGGEGFGRVEEAVGHAARVVVVVERGAARGGRGGEGHCAGVPCSSATRHGEGA